jgi:hypothetical protein
MTSVAASIAGGVLDSVSAGILLYAATVELMVSLRPTSIPRKVHVPQECSTVPPPPFVQLPSLNYQPSAHRSLATSPHIETHHPLVQHRVLTPELGTRIRV